MLLILMSEMLAFKFCYYRNRMKFLICFLIIVYLIFLLLKIVDIKVYLIFLIEFIVISI